MPGVKRHPISLCLRCPLGDAQAERSGGKRRCDLELRTGGSQLSCCLLQWCFRTWSQILNIQEVRQAEDWAQSLREKGPKSPRMLVVQGSSPAFLCLSDALSLRSS